MNKNELIHNLKGGNVQVTFKKSDGDIRKMICTLHEDVIPKTSGKKKENKEVLVVCQRKNNKIAIIYLILRSMLEMWR